ncbi:18890_t:CDS:2 [Rhizophagus irregularis]|nr:18890_t:CDS:2 [Rhizophagus irregularis]
MNNTNNLIISTEVACHDSNIENLDLPNGKWQTGNTPIRDYIDNLSNKDLRSLEKKNIMFMDQITTDAGWSIFIGMGRSKTQQLKQLHRKNTEGIDITLEQSTEDGDFWKNVITRYTNLEHF